MCFLSSSYQQLIFFFCAALSGERREVGERSLNSVSENNSLLDFGAFNSQCADKKFLDVKWDWFFFGKFPWVNKVFIIIVRTRGNLTPVNFSSSFLFDVFPCGEETSCCRRRVYINKRWMSDMRQAWWRRFFSLFCDKTHRLSREDAKPDRHTNQNQYRESDDN